jgi:hypothetical protein
MTIDDADASASYVAEELLAAYREQRPVRVREATRRQWFDTIGPMFNAGEAAVVEHAVRSLRDQRPRWRRAERMCRVFDNLPPPGPDALPFGDDRDSDLQVVARAGSDAVLLCFCGNANRMGLPLPLMHRWLGELPCSLVYLRDTSGRSYLDGTPSAGRDWQALLDSLRATIADLGAGRVFCFGVSSGSLPALRCGLALGAESVVAFGGPLVMSPSFNKDLRKLTIFDRIGDDAPAEITDISISYMDAPAAPRALLVYGADNWDDRIHAMHVGRAPSVELFPVEDCDQHPPVFELVCRGQFEQFLEWIFAPGSAGRSPLAREDQT